MKTITLHFGNILEEMKNKNIRLCLIRNTSWFITDKNNQLYQIEIEKYGSYLDKLIRDEEVINFNIVDEKYIEDWEKEFWDVSKVKNFIRNIVCIEYPEIKEQYKAVYKQ